MEPVGAAMARLPEMEAVGVPELTLMSANLAEEVALEPMRRSVVSLTGERAPDASLQ